MGKINPTKAQLESLGAANAEQPIVMLNLLKYRQEAQYPQAYLTTSGEKPCSGRAAYQRYAAVAQNKVRQVGGKLLWASPADMTIIGEEEETWDDVLLVYYPSRQAFLTMIDMADYKESNVHRAAALLRTCIVQCDGNNVSSFFKNTKKSP